MATIEMRSVSKKYGVVEVLRDIDLTIADGEFIVLVGPSGCGKSTLLRMVAGLEPITGGDFAIGGKLMNDVPPATATSPWCSSPTPSTPICPSAGTWAFPWRSGKLPRPERKGPVAKAAATLGLDKLLDRYPKALSGGQRQRVAMGRAIVRAPQAFLFDEPLSNLDAALRVEMRLEIARLHQRLSTTMLYVTHDQVEAMTLADRVVVLDAGRMQQVGTPLDLYETPANRFVATFIGSPNMNILDGTPGDGGLRLGDGTLIPGPKGPCNWA